jgi:hypothetical protein
MVGSPLLSAVADYLGILRVRGDLVAVIVVAAAALAIRLAADALLGTVLRWLKGLLAITAATGRRQAGFLRSLLKQPLEEIKDEQSREI